jgi:tRNA(Ile)-lysidine synthase
VLEQLATDIRKRKLFSDREPILVAVSGGIDSIVLLHLLHRFAESTGWKLAVAHFNHKLRGRESDADEKFVLTLSKKLNVPIFVGRADVAAHAKKSGQSIEMAARELRHRFFAKVARAKKIQTIALAHNADDQVELFFLRLLRGASVEGLAGMKWRAISPADKKVQLTRPLLATCRRDIEAFARENKLRWREDTSNKSVDFLRNRVRHHLIPLLEKNYQPALRKTVSRLMQVIAAESDVVSALTARANTGAFAKQPVAIQRRLLQQQIHALGLAADFDGIETLRLNPGKISEANPTTRLRRDEHGTIEMVAKQAGHFSSQSHKVVLTQPTTTTSFADCEIVFEITKQTDARFTARAQTEFFDADKVGKRITVRHWQPGDRFQPIGNKSLRKLQDMFVDLKIPKAERHERIIAATSSKEIFWVEGLRISENFKLTPKTKRRLVLRWQRRQ